MTSVAVIAHRRKVLDGGLDELRKRLGAAGFTDPIWSEVDKSRKAPKQVRKALDAGADLVLVWGGDGIVQRTIDTLAGRDVPIGILPAGTANLLATNLGIPIELAGALDVALHGDRRRLDVGVVNGERFAVMAGTGFDAEMIRNADRKLKDKTGRLAYVWSGARALRVPRRRMRVRVDDATFFDGEASCVLVGNVSTISGGMTPFADARPDDGVLDVGVVTAKGPAQWARVLTRVVTHKTDKAKHAMTTRGRTIDVKIDKAVPYELDGGERPEVKRLKITVEPAAIVVCVPTSDA
jgi:YegS/Rv2252/BmrU family lipid kinase